MMKRSSMKDFPGDKNSLNSHFDEEFWWVFGYGILVVLVTISNLLMFCSIGKNSFLRTNAHWLFMLLSCRHVLRAIFSLGVLYITRFNHPKDGWKYSKINSTKIGNPALCDIFCFLDLFLIVLPMFILVSLAVHFLTRYPSPQIGKLAPKVGLQMRQYTVNPISFSLKPKQSPWTQFLYPTLPIFMATLLCLPVPLLHLTHKLIPVPGGEKFICGDTSSHLSFDVSVFMLGYALPFLLVLFLGLGLIIRRCIQCSRAHCCNSWCKEESVFIQIFIIFAFATFFLFIPTLDNLADKLDLNDEIMNVVKIVSNFILSQPEIARVFEMGVNGLALPLIIYIWMPTYRTFNDEPDLDDVNLSKPSKSSKAIQITKKTTEASPSFEPVPVLPVSNSPKK